MISTIHGFTAGVFTVTFCQGFLVPVFSRFSSLMGKEIRDTFEEKRKPVLRCLGSCMFTKPCKYAVNCIVSCICVSNGVELFFCLLFFLGVLWRKKHWQERT